MPPESDDGLVFGEYAVDGRDKRPQSVCVRPGRPWRIILSTVRARNAGLAIEAPERTRAVRQPGFVRA
jgi:hypothetical protein